jgi:glycine/D-amino acid oxidase-like deaminating enzyme/nitrite reductase/ring-hydroxylating ferredoxin subunit
MKSDSGSSISVWMATAAKPTSQLALSQDMHCDVCIVGAGIAGMSIAYMLTRAGKSVIVLDDGPIGGGETSRTTAHLTNAIDDRYFEIERLHGEKNSRLAAASHTQAIAHIEAIAAEEQIACDFERLDGYLFAAPGGSQKELQRELEAAHRAGLADVEFVARAPIDSFDTGPALRFPRQAQFHPLKYLSGLIRSVERDRGRIFTGAHVTKIEGGAAARVEIAGGAKVNSGAVVVATNTPVNDRVAIHTKQAAYRTYVVGARVARSSVTRALYWDTEDPYHYVRLQSVADGRDILIVGGEDHKTGQQDDSDSRFARLEAWSRERFPSMEAIEFRWSGQIMEPVDGVAFIGRNPIDEDNVYIATGDSGMGMTHGTIAGMLLTDLILRRENPWAELYDPSRKTVNTDYVRENLNVARQYTDFVTRGDVRSVDDVARGTGAVIRRGLKKVAVYRDDDGALHEKSAVCPHLGCVVAWNSLEKTWDCPCHGSRFDRYGTVVNGPALGGLAPAEE